MHKKIALGVIVAVLSANSSRAEPAVPADGTRTSAAVFPITSSKGLLTPKAYGAMGDVHQSNASMDDGSPVLTIANTPGVYPFPYGFTSTDCNSTHGAGCTGSYDKQVVVFGAGSCVQSRCDSGHPILRGTTGTTTARSRTFSDPAANFPSSIAGSTIQIQLADTEGPDGAAGPFTTTVSSRTNRTTLLLAMPPAVSLTGTAVYTITAAPLYATIVGYTNPRRVTLSKNSARTFRGPDDRPPEQAFWGTNDTNALAAFASGVSGRYDAIVNPSGFMPTVGALDPGAFYWSSRPLALTNGWITGPAGCSRVGDRGGAGIFFASATAAGIDMSQSVIGGVCGFKVQQNDYSGVLGGWNPSSGVILGCDSSASAGCGGGAHVFSDARVENMIVSGWSRSIAAVNVNDAHILSNHVATEYGTAIAILNDSQGEVRNNEVQASSIGISILNGTGGEIVAHNRITGCGTGMDNSTGGIVIGATLPGSNSNIIANNQFQGDFGWDISAIGRRAGNTGAGNLFSGNTSDRGALGMFYIKSMTAPVMVGNVAYNSDNGAANFPSDSHSAIFDLEGETHSASFSANRSHSLGNRPINSGPVDGVYAGSSTYGILPDSTSSFVVTGQQWNLKGRLAYEQLGAGGVNQIFGRLSGFSVDTPSTPSAPNVDQGGTVRGSTSVNYYLQCVDSNGNGTAPSPAGRTAYSPAKRTPNNYNRIYWTPFPGCACYNVYETDVNHLLTTYCPPAGEVNETNSAVVFDTGQQPVSTPTSALSPGLGAISARIVGYTTVYSGATAPRTCIDDTFVCVSDSAGCTNGTKYSPGGSTRCQTYCRSNTWVESGAGC